MKSIFSICFLIVVSTQSVMSQNTVSVFDNSGEKIKFDESVHINDLPKYFVFVPDNSSLKIMRSEVTRVSEGLGYETIKGNKILKLTDQLVDNLKDGDFLSIEIVFQGQEKSTFINLPIKE